MTADEYLREVEFALRDLPWGQRRDLVADLRQHLAELPAGSSLVSRLGTPEQYASDLRAAEGLERRRGPVAFLRARRPRNLVLTIIVLTLAGLAIGAVAWIDSYQPLIYGNGTQLPLDSRSTPGAPGVTVTFRKGRPFLYGVTIRNNRRFTVRILGVPTHVWNFYKARLFVNKPNVSEDERPLQPFRPFDLHPGEARWLVWKGVYACTTGAEGQLPRRIGQTFSTTEAVDVRYSFLWRTATAEIPLEEPLTISFDKKGCPPGGDPPAKR